MLKVRAIRIQKNIPASELIKLLGIKSKATFYKKERGLLRFSLDEAKKISCLFKMDLAEIFFNE
jgi:putative transcriptional regulator